MSDGRTLVLGVAAGLALAGAWRRRGSVARTSPPVLHVVPKAEWPHLVTSGRAQIVDCPTELWTTQAATSPEVVATKVARLRAGEALGVSLIRAAGRTWVFDGHHTLEAYRQIGRTPECWLYTRSAGGDWLAAPRLRRKRGSRATGRTVRLAELPPDMVVLLGDFMEERYGSEEGEAALPATFPIRLVAVESLYRQVQHDAWDDRGPEHVVELAAEMARLVPKAERTNPEAIADRLLALVPYTEYDRGQRVPRAPGVAIPPIVTFSGSFADGRHRLFAAHQLGITHLPAIEMDDLGPKAGSRAVAPVETVRDDLLPAAFRDRLTLIIKTLTSTQQLWEPIPGTANGARPVRYTYEKFSIALRERDRPEGPGGVGGLHASAEFASDPTKAQLRDSTCVADLAHLRARFPSIRGVAVVTGSSVDAEHRGKGLGSALYTALLEATAAVSLAIVPERCWTGTELTSEDALRVWTSLAKRYPSEGFVVWGGAKAGSAAVAKKVFTVPCPRCLGKKVFEGHRHVLGGRCFQCEGRGTIETLTDPAKAAKAKVARDAKREKERQARVSRMNAFEASVPKHNPDDPRIGRQTRRNYAEFQSHRPEIDRMLYALDRGFDEDPATGEQKPVPAWWARNLAR